MTPLLHLDRISKSFGPTAAVHDLSLDLHAGEILALIGPSGCGKTTTLRLIAGFEVPGSGQILRAGQPITALPPERRGIGIVFQDYALFPHLSVAQNILFGAPDADLAALCALVGLTGLEQRFPDQLSGGQQQRVALARTLAVKPDIILLDEPFSNLDASLRQRARAEMRRLLKETGCAILLVTHDQEEALGFADRVAVMQAGRLHQIDTARAVYDHPISAIAARALGPVMLIDGIANGDACATPLGPCRLASPAQGPVTLALRPHHILPDPNGTPARLITSTFAGGQCHHSLQVADIDLQMTLSAAYPLPDPLFIALDQMHRFSPLSPE
ncbi:ABC transporter ATP-binding protein [Ketogulonicigenium vulgare]|uniref:ABC transporter ATP-binding protein n=1 Tax=Ketogulonicigenium vulgare TaxID=92945 RepID=UPI0023598563|nr:ABC transporter ATP-binding protein [Ketogulonicigenium vulgare]